MNDAIKAEKEKLWKPPEMWKEVSYRIIASSVQFIKTQINKMDSIVQF